MKIALFVLMFLAAEVTCFGSFPPVSEIGSIIPSISKVVKTARRVIANTASQKPAVANATTETTKKSENTTTENPTTESSIVTIATIETTTKSITENLTSASTKSTTNNLSTITDALKPTETRKSTTEIKPETTTTIKTTVTELKSTVEPSITSTLAHSSTNSTTSYTTTEKPTTNEIPTTSSPFERFDFLVTDYKTGIPCVMSKMSIGILMKYLKTDGKLGHAYLEVPKTARSTGSCKEKVSNMILTWTELNRNTSHKNGENQVEFIFINDGSTFHMDLVRIYIYLDPENFPNATTTRLFQSTTAALKMFPASIKSGMHVCDSDTTIVLNNLVRVWISNTFLIAFNRDKEISRRTVQSCVVITTMAIGTIVSIVIGVIVIISIISVFIWWRRKSTMSKFS